MFYLLTRSNFRPLSCRAISVIFFVSLEFLTKTFPAHESLPWSPMTVSPQTQSVDHAKLESARRDLDAHVREIVSWHFDPETGTPFWLEFASKLGFDPRTEIKTFADLKKLGLFHDEWLRGGPVRRWVPKAFATKPTYVFETGGTTGIPKSRVAMDDFRTDYELFSQTLPEQYFPKGTNWLMLGPSGPRRLRLAVEHLCQFRGGICFCVDLDPRWVIKLINKGWMEHLEAYKQHVIDQAITILGAGHDIRCMFATPKLLESLANALEKKGSTIKQTGITGIFSGGTEFTPQWTRFAVEELLGGPPERSGIYMTPTYGNTLMGLACSKPVTAADGYKITYYAPQPRARVEIVDFNDPHKVVEYGQTGRVKLTTLTKEFFVPGFLERDEGEREAPYEKYPWDGVSGVRPFHEFAATTTVGVY
jgi:phenylacetate-coenzyme A ligase PaaK-like adenylate-forming protein